MPKAKVKTKAKSLVKTSTNTEKKPSKQGAFGLEKDMVLKMLIALPVIASVVSFLFKVDFMTSIGLFLALPAIVLSMFLPFSIKKSAIFSFLTLPVGFVISYIAHVLGQWSIPTSVFPLIFGVVPAEEILWVFLVTYTTIMFYEYFLDRHNDRALYNKKFVYVYAMFIVVPLLYFVIGFVMPDFFNIQYFYLTCGIFTVLIPIVYFLLRFPALRNKFVTTGFYFFYLGIIYELTALARYWWAFPSTGQYIGMVEFLGIAFPIEELVFSLILYSAAVLAWYEFFDDDRE